MIEDHLSREEQFLSARLRLAVRPLGGLRVTFVDDVARAVCGTVGKRSRSSIESLLNCESNADPGGIHHSSPGEDSGRALKTTARSLHSQSLPSANYGICGRMLGDSHT